MGNHKSPSYVTRYEPIRLALKSASASQNYDLDCIKHSYYFCIVEFHAPPRHPARGRAFNSSSPFWTNQLSKRQNIPSVRDVHRCTQVQIMARARTSLAFLCRLVPRARIKRRPCAIVGLAWFLMVASLRSPSQQSDESQYHTLWTSK